MGGFTKGGLKLKSSVASAMVSMMPAAAPAGPYVVGILAVAAFVAEVVEWMSSDDTTPKAIAKLQEAVNHLYYLVDMLDARLDVLIDQVAIESNRQTLRDLKDYLDEIKDVRSQLQNLPADVGTSAAIANRAGLIADKFLRDNYEIWCWTDVVLKPVLDEHGNPLIDPTTGQIREEPALATLAFKNVPTLPVYLLAVLTWLTARERVVRLGGRDRLEEDAERVRRHLDAVTVRPEFRKHAPEERHSDGSIKWTAIPTSLPEHIKAHIISKINASTKYPVDRTCMFWFDLQNWMTGETAYAGDFDLLMESNDVLCTVDPLQVAPPDAEIEAEEAAGIASLEGLRQVLERVALSGTVRKQFIGQFPNWVASKANYYAINALGELLWFEHMWTSQHPGVPVALAGPRKLADGWNTFKQLLPAGDKGIYAMRADGTLIWYRHEGAFDGRVELTGPVDVGTETDWNVYSTIVAGGNGVLYGLMPDGNLYWHRHEGFENGGGAGTWRPRVQIGSGWNIFKRIFSAGDGTLYGVKPDGTLVWYFHKGATTGAPDWEASIEVGSGWQNFAHIFGAGDGVIYAAQPNGQLLWYCHKNWKQGAEIQFVTIGGQQVPISLAPVPVWEGPVVVNDDRARYRYMFGVLPKPLVVGGGVR